jgi:methyl-accepting chemotaxis protein
MSRKFMSLKYKITGGFLVLILFSSMAIGFYSYYNAKSNIERVVGNTALSIIESIVNTIDDEKFQKLQTNENMESEYYKELQTHLSDLRNATGLKYLYTMRKTDNGKCIYVVDGTPMDDKNFSSLGDEEEDVTDVMEGSFQGVAGYEFSSDDWGNSISAYIPIKDKSGKVVGVLGADFDANNMVSQLNKFKTNIIIIIIAVILIGIFIGQIMSIILVRSLNKLKKQAELIKEGDLTVKFDNAGNDEIGILTHAFKDMVDNLLVITNKIKKNTKDVVYEIDDLYKSFSETSKATEEINKVITEIAAGAVKQTHSAEVVSKSMNEVFHQVKKSVDYANLVSDSSNQAVANTTHVMEILKTSIEKVTTVNTTVEQTAAIIKELGSKSKEISSFSDTISQIAKQTNLLSLNAAIEAARAGEQGKGFAVVANEVKVLAEQSNDASSQIGHIASSMQAEIDNAIKTIQSGVVQASEGVNAVTKVDTYLLELKESSNEANIRVKEIIKAINLIEESCKYAVSKVSEFADISRNFSAGSQQAAASTEEETAIIAQIKENIESIKHTTYYLNDVVNKFKID